MFQLLFLKGAAVAEWLSSWLAEKEDRVRLPALPLEFSEIGYLLLPSRDMAKIPLKRRKSSIQPTNRYFKISKLQELYRHLSFFFNFRAFLNFSAFKIVKPLP